MFFFNVYFSTFSIYFSEHTNDLYLVPHDSRWSIPAYDVFFCMSIKFSKLAIAHIFLCHVYFILCWVLLMFRISHCNTMIISTLIVKIITQIYYYFVAFRKCISTVYLKPLFTNYITFEPLFHSKHALICVEITFIP